MKKNFFKKLSFVLALAMIVSVIAPAAGAFAASKPKLNETKKYLHLDKDGANDFDFNIKNKVKGWKYDWSSANDKVATVKSNGLVTSKGVGTTKVSVVISDKDGEEVKELTATVVVRDNIASVDITKTPAGDKLAVGVENDFNRSFKTVSGSTKKTSSVTRWTVDNDATISDKGVFVATAAGEYTITARSFQSSAKYTSWVSDNAKYASYVLATDTYKVTVAPSMVATKQIDEDTFEVTFDSAVTDAATKLTLSQQIAATKVNVLIKEVKMDAANKVATVDVYVPFAEEGVFVVDYPTLASVQFVAAKKDATLVTSIGILTTKVEMGKAEKLDIALYNKDGVNIATDELLYRVDIDSSNSASHKDGRELTLFNVGDTTTITATYHTYTYDTVGAETGALKATGVITCVDVSKDATGSIDAYTVIDSTKTPNWKDVKHSVAAEDSNFKLFVQLKGKDKDGNVLLTDNDSQTPSANVGTKTWEYTSSNPEIVIVGADGFIYPARAGSSVIVVKYDEVIVGTAVITVTGARRVASLTLDNYNFILSDHATLLDTKTVKATVKDQLGDDMTLGAGYDIETVYTGTTGDDGTLLSSGAATDEVLFAGVGVTDKTYSYKVTATDKGDDKIKISRYIQVTVKTPKELTGGTYSVEVSKKAVDTNIKNGDDSFAPTVDVALYTIASNGVKNGRVPLGTGSFTIEVDGPNSTNDDDTFNSGTVGNFALIADDGGFAKKVSKGTYKVTAKNASSKAIDVDYFTVTDTQEVPVLKVIKTYSEKDTLAEAIEECLEITLDGKKVSATSFEYKYSATSSDTTVFVTKVFVEQEFTGKVITNKIKIKHEIAVNRTINFDQDPK